MAENERRANLERLKNLKDSGGAWHEIARTLAVAGEGLSAKDWKVLLEEASRGMRMSPVVLARYVSLLDRIVAIAGSPDQVEALMPPRFSSGEIAARIHERDAARGLKALRDLRDRTTTLERLRKDLTELTSNRKQARGHSLRERAKMVAAVEALVTSKGDALFGTDCIALRRMPLRHLVRDGYDILDGRGVRIAGMDLYLPESPGSGRDPLENLARSVLLSFYGRHFYICFAPGFDEQVLVRARRVIAAFGAEWIGIVWMTDELSIRMYKNPDLPPSPDRSEQYDRLVEGLRHPVPGG